VPSWSHLIEVKVGDDARVLGGQSELTDQPPDLRVEGRGSIFGIPNLRQLIGIPGLAIVATMRGAPCYASHQAVRNTFGAAAKQFSMAASVIMVAAPTFRASRRPSRIS
jgi:hypothetical protein